MDFETYEEQINEKLKNEIERILQKEELDIEEIRFLDSIIASNKMKKLANLM